MHFYEHSLSIVVGEANRPLLDEHLLAGKRRSYLAMLDLNFLLNQTILL